MLPKTHKVKFFLDQRVRHERLDWGHLTSQKPSDEPSKALTLVNRLLEEGLENSRDDLEALCKCIISDMLNWKQMPIKSRRLQSYKDQLPPHSDEVLTRIMTLSAELDAEDLFFPAYLLWTERFNCSTIHEVGSRDLFASPQTFLTVGTAFAKYDLESWLSLQ